MSDAEEIEVTDAMIEAGAGMLEVWSQSEDQPEMFLQAIYLAMEQERRRGESNQ